ncbi:hypothetical protein [Roseovarius sp. MMSF_3305]|uniref:hypothetical protein n=1 Tax=Roseovarius sp. MMSF_3305 TaxID=3046697 RepID=UPI00273FCD95|nr:hypothetical protein [Roseovarius sp. MMSF_3305]
MAINCRQTRFIFAKSEEPQFGAQPTQIASPCGRSGDRAAGFALDSAREVKVERKLWSAKQLFDVRPGGRTVSEPTKSGAQSIALFNNGRLGHGGGDDAE